MPAGDVFQAEIDRRVVVVHDSVRDVVFAGDIELSVAVEEDDAIGDCETEPARGCGEVEVLPEYAKSEFDAGGVVEESMNAWRE